MKRAAFGYPHLRRLCGAYLNADFEAYGTPQDAIATFAAAATPEVAQATRDEIARFLVAHRTDAARLRGLERMRFGVSLPSFGFESATDLLERVDAALARPRA